MDSREGSPSGEEKEKKAIHGILVKILDKWQTQIQEGVKEDLEETLVISPEASQRGTSPPLRDKETEEILQETVILAPQRTTREAQSPSTEPASKSKEISEKDQFLEETVILKPRKIRDKANG